MKNVTTAKLRKFLKKTITNFRVQKPRENKIWKIVSHFFFSRSAIYEHFNRIDNPRRNKKRKRK